MAPLHDQDDMPVSAAAQGANVAVPNVSADAAATYAAAYKATAPMSFVERCCRTHPAQVVARERSAVVGPCGGG